MRLVTSIALIRYCTALNLCACAEPAAAPSIVLIGGAAGAATAVLMTIVGALVLFRRRVLRCLRGGDADAQLLPMDSSLEKATLEVGRV